MKFSWNFLAFIGATIVLCSSAMANNTPAESSAPKEQPVMVLNCEDSHYSISDSFFLLNADGPQQQLYLIQNVSGEPLILSHYQPTPEGASAGWFSELKPNHWSALAMDKEKFVLSCQHASSAVSAGTLPMGDSQGGERILPLENKPKLSLGEVSNHRKEFPEGTPDTAANSALLNCSKVLSICEMPQASFPKLNLGSYWVTENESFSNLVAEIRRIGIHLPDSPSQLKTSTTATNTADTPASSADPSSSNM